MTRRYADALAFPFPQANIMKKEGLVVDRTAALDLCQITGVPPFLQRINDILPAQLWFGEVMKRPENAGLACVFGLQHPPEDATIDDLQRLREAGVRFTTIAYEGCNRFGGGFAEPDAPLTREGQEFLDMLAQIGIVLDLSHAGFRTAREVLSYITRRQLPLKVVATHTASYSQYGHLRNLPDDILRGIQARGGFVGLVMMTWMLHESDNTATPFYEHLKALVNLLGHEHVGIGSDAVYQRLDPTLEERLFIELDRAVDPRKKFKARFPTISPSLNSPDRLRTVENELIMRGWGEKAITAIVGGTVGRFLSELV